MQRQPLPSPALRSSLRNIQLLEKLLPPTQVGYSDGMERLSGNRYTWCASRKSVQKTSVDHIAVHAASMDSFERHRLTSNKSVQANLHGSGASPMDVYAFAMIKGGKKGGKGKDKGSKPSKFDGNCFWWGAYGHAMEDCRKKAAGKPQAPKTPRGSDPKPKGKRLKYKKETSLLDEWPDGQDGQEVAGLFIVAVSRHVRYSRRYWQPWEKIQKQAHRQWKAYKNGGHGDNAVDGEMGDRIDLTNDSGCVACGLPVGVASAVVMQELNRIETLQSTLLQKLRRFEGVGSRLSNFRMVTCRI